jgi:signal transduction histidine kinase/HPt (histidine-containing phosphotransfer) domain-containing protein/ActR/RegA family two-component response regulator
MTRTLLAFSSVRQKLFAGVLLTSLVALLISAGSLFLYDLHSYRQSSSTALGVEAELLGHASSAALQFDDRAVATQNLGFLRARPTIRAAAVYDWQGAPFATYSRNGVPMSEIPALAGREGIAIDGERVVVFRRIVADNETLGTVYLVEDLELHKRIASYAAIALAVMLAALVASAALSAWLQTAITRPIIEISKLAREVVEKRDYTLRANRTTRDETGTLVDAFNEMLSEIQRRTAALESSSEEVTRLNKDLERRVKKRTAQLEESNLQLKGANQAKSNFLSMMSHEIRTPMNGVLGMLELLSLGGLDPAQRTTLGIVRDSGRSLLRIIDDILDFSKIEAGKLEVRGEVASIAQVMASVVGVYSGNASSKALVLKSYVDPDISPAVIVDPLRLQQILNNLVSNAIKFTLKGFVEIRAELVERREGIDVVAFAVTDTGIGISEEAQAALFTPFVQADRDITRVFGGTGLGLSIGQRLATLMGGSIGISSELGKGTTVNLTLPLPIADPHLLPAFDTSDERDALANMILARRPAPSAAEAEAEGTLVLVVDDHPINRMLIMRQVTVLGYAAEEAREGREALEAWMSGRFALVITDCNMPVMDGYELARSIRANEKAGGKRTLIIACTANALKGEAENCFAAGMDDYIAKPVELAKLLAKLELWLPVPLGNTLAQTPRPVESAGPADDGAPVIDRAVLAEIAGGDPNLEREVFRQFLAVNREDVVQLSRALLNRDMARVTHFAHRIKGASSSIGARALAEACGRMETAARAENWNAVDANEAAFHREASRLDEYLGALTQA